MLLKTTLALRCLIKRAGQRFFLISGYENIGGMKALSKSKEYVKGRWFGVFLRLIVVFIFNVAIYIVLTFLTGLLGFPAYAKTIASYAISAVIGPIIPIYLLFLYQNLRSVKGET